MGFIVTLKHDDDALLRRVLRVPSGFLGRPYAGYLVFLFDCVSQDRDAARWFADNAESLDALTGHDIAFPVFAMEAKATVEVPRSPRRVLRASREIEFPLDVDHGDCTVERLISRLREGPLLDGDTAHWVNRGAYRVAKLMGVLDLMPCVVVLDAVPDPSKPPLCIPMRGAILEEIFPRLRKAMGLLQRNPEIGVLRQRLAEWHSAMSAFQREEDQEPEIPVDGEDSLSDKVVTAQVRRLASELSRGGVEAASEILKPLSELDPDPSRVHRVMEAAFPRLVQTMKAISVLSRADRDWPLEGAKNEAFLAKWKQVVAPLLDPDSERLPTTREEIRSSCDEAIAERQRIRGQLNREIPVEPECWLAWAAACRAAREQDLAVKRSERQAAFSEDVLRLTRELLEWGDRPSWSAVMGEAFRGCSGCRQWEGGSHGGSGRNLEAIRRLWADFRHQRAGEIARLGALGFSVYWFSRIVVTLGANALGGWIPRPF